MSEPRRIARARWSAAATGAILVATWLAAPLAGASGPAPRAQSGPTMANLTAVAFDGARAGYGLFATSSGSSCRTWVARTVNGGATFSAPVHLQGCNTSIAADTRGDVFVYGRQLLVSHDDGAAFAQLPSFTDVDQIVAVGAASVWLATAVCAKKAAVSCPLHVYDSTNGGATWSLTKKQPAGAVGWAAGGGGTYLVRVNGGIGYVLSHPPNIGRSSALYYTGNGGRSWATRSLPCPKGVGGYFNATASPRGALWAACAGLPDGHVQMKSVEVSVDEGASWQKGAVCRNTTSLLCQGTLDGIATISWHSAWLSSTHGPLLVSHDSGASWAAVAQIGDAVGGPPISTVQFFNEHDAVAIGTAPSGHPVLLWWTDNGGETWTVTRPSL